jgi:cytochrome c5
MIHGICQLLRPALPFVLAALPLTLSTACDSGGSSKVEQQYNQYCSACHSTGAAGAPKKGDAASWEPRLAKGEQELVKSVREGIVGMPAKGLCQECTDEDFKALIQYMSP